MVPLIHWRLKGRAHEGAGADPGFDLRWVITVGAGRRETERLRN